MTDFNNLNALFINTSLKRTADKQPHPIAHERIRRNHEKKWGFGRAPVSRHPEAVPLT